MRIDRLDLIRYGRFSDVSLTFPRSQTDIHFIYGQNEAGKSTSLAAIEDLLFGIDHSSPYNFLHAYPAMRIGAVLEEGGRVLELQRRKGSKDTILGPDGLPLPAGEGALAPFLQGITQDFFVRVMSLNHVRLTQGGREILEARDDVGQTLFAAGTGLSGLREHLAQLEEEANELWAPRHADRRKYYKALGAFQAAEKAQRDHTVTAAHWLQLKRAFDEAQDACRELNEAIESRSAEQRKLGRIRRVHYRITRLAEIDNELAQLGEPIDFPPDAESQLTGSLTSLTGVQSKLEELAEQRDRLTEQCAALRCDDSALRHAEEINQLHRLRIEVQKEKLDLPRRQDELGGKEKELRALARELGWDCSRIDAVLERLPARAGVSAARTLLQRRGVIAGDRKSAREALVEAEGDADKLRRERDEMEAALDVSALDAAMLEGRRLADVGARIDGVEKERRESEAALSSRLKTLRPQVAGPEALAEMPVPGRAVTQKCREAWREHEQRAQRCRDRLETTERDLRQERQTYERRKLEKEGIAPEALASSRGDRDAGWRFIRRRYIDGEELPEGEVVDFIGLSADLPAAYERRVEAADALADRRFENAEAAGEMALMQRQLDERELEIAKLREEQRTLEREREELVSAWRQLWAPSGLEPLAPDLMLDWLDARSEAMELLERREAAKREAAEWRRREAEARTGILTELTQLGESVQGLAERPLSVAIDRAGTVLQRQEKLAHERKVLAKRILEADAEVARKRSRLERVEEDWTSWQGQWNSALDALGLDSTALPDIAGGHLETLEAMRALSGEIAQLRDRIGKMERDISAFVTAVQRLVSSIGAELTRHESEEAVIQLETRLEEANRIENQRQEKDQAIALLEKRIKECEESRESAQQAIERLQSLAGVEDTDRLKEAIHRAQRSAELRMERGAVEKALTTAGDGLTLSELRSECAGINLDQIAAQERTLETDLKELRERLIPATEKRMETRMTFDAVGGDGAAARAAAERQEALAAMRSTVERFVRVRTSTVLLRWAIERYRRERQGPLLIRAGGIFAELTSGSFVGLKVEYDADDKPRLVGVREDQSSVGVSGMSEGTADQLYLALRIASVEEYLGRGQAMPFVADDLLINFDDQRATAALRALGQLASNTQVLFFTHHRHLLEIARGTFGGAINVISLTDDRVASAA